MNCQETSHLLDSTAREALTLMHCEAIDRHLASCPACRADWTNWGEIVDLPVPPMPVTLRARIAAALPARQAPPRRVFRPYVVGGLLMLGAGLAAALALQLARYGQESALGLAIPSVESIPAAPSLPAAGAGLALNTAVPAEERAASPAAASVAMDPHRILVLKRPELAADARAIALADQCHDAITGQLRAFGGLQLVNDAAIYKITTLEETTRLQERDRSIARTLGAGSVLVISTWLGCTATLFKSQSGDVVPGASGGTGTDAQGEVEPERLHSFAVNIATEIRNRTLMDRDMERAATRTALFDAALSDNERARALEKFVADNSGHRRKALPESASAEVIATMVYLGTKSPDADVRVRAWVSSRDVATDDPSLVQALLQSLVADPAEDVRYQAAFALHPHIDKPGVLAALRRAAAEDVSREPKYVCCIPTVREAAQRAAVADGDFQAWTRSVLFDTSLPARSRLLPVLDSTPDGRLAILDKEAARVVFDIGRREQDPKVRQMAWNSLRMGAPDAAFLPVLLEDLTGHADQYVRAAAGQVLAGHAGNPDVRQGFERAQDDQSMEVRRVAIDALKRADRH